MKNIISHNLKYFDIVDDKLVYLELIIEELFVNIFSYAYEDESCIRLSYWR